MRKRPAGRGFWSVDEEDEVEEEDESERGVKLRWEYLGKLPRVC